MEKTKDEAMKVFEENHVKVFNELTKAQASVKGIEDYHIIQKQMFDQLSKQNNEAITLHNEVKKVFEEESQNFFTERIKWKSDANNKILGQGKVLDQMKSTMADLQNKFKLN